MVENLFVFADGGSRGNPGPAAIGFVVRDDAGKTLVRKGKFIGRATNNVAEYTAVIEALKWLSSNINPPPKSKHHKYDKQWHKSQPNHCL